VIATTTAIPVSALEAVRAAAPPRTTLLGFKKDEFPVALARHGRALELFEHSGAVLRTALVFLDEKRGIDLMHSRHDGVASAITQARGSPFFLLGEEHLPLAGKLAESDAGIDELAAFFNASNEAHEGPEVGEALREGIQFLRRALDEVTAGTVVLVAIL
jgi:hypothetical protein